MQSSRPSRVSGSALSASQRWALTERWGSIEAAAAEAERREPAQFERLWASWDTWPTTTTWPAPQLAPQAAYAAYSKPEFWEAYWELALRALDENEPGPAHVKKRGAGRYGKDYPGVKVESVVRLAQGEQFGRTLRNRIATQEGVTTYMVDLVFALMKAHRLAVDERSGWLKIDGEFSATPAFVNLHELLSDS